MKHNASDPDSISPTFTELKTSADGGLAINPNEIVLGRVSRCDSASQPVVEYRIGSQDFQRVAMTTQGLHPECKGRQVALTFINCDLLQPLVLGVIRNSLDDAIESFSSDSTELHPDVFSDSLFLDSESESTDKQVDTVIVDGQRVRIEGKEEIVFKCGSASITLTKSGKIVLRGKYLVSRSSGVNRILGGSVQVN